MILLLKKVHNIQHAMRNINNGMLNYTRPRTQLLLSFEDAVKEGDWEREELCLKFTLLQEDWSNKVCSDMLVASYLQQVLSFSCR